jgi:hypothetical protein
MDRTPQRGQRLLFSATLDNGVDVLVRRYLDSPVTHSVDGVAAAPPAMTHHVLEVAATDKAQVVTELASGHGRSLLFTRTKHSAKKLARKLTAAGIPAADLHGNLSQNARERNLEGLSAGDVRVLVATDIAARGVHVGRDRARRARRPPDRAQGIPAPLRAYSEGGAEGVVVTVMTAEQRRDVADLIRRANISPVRAVVRPGDAGVRALSGEPVARRPLAAAPATGAPQPTRPPQRPADRPAPRNRSRRRATRRAGATS